MSRSQERSTWPEIVRIQQLESDADVSEKERDELRANVSKIATSTNRMIISATGAAILFAADIVARVALR